MTDIDLIIPMVFPADPEWQREYARYSGRDARSHVRYRSWDTEELLVRCCLKYMPWLRRIHILLARESQVQGWMERIADAQTATDGPRLSIVFHRDFMPGKCLPCFSSPCFEMFLGDIPGLSEQFIYANDDMFPLSPLAPEDFFRGGLPCQHVREEPFPAIPNMFQRKCMFQQNMIGAPFGRSFSTTWLRGGHSFAPLLKASCREVWRRHGRELERHLYPLQRTDRSCNHYIFWLYQHFAGLYVDHAPRRQLVLDSVPTDSLAAIIRDPGAGIVCINDNESIRDWRRRAAVVREALEDKVKH